MPLEFVIQKYLLNSPSISKSSRDRSQHSKVNKEVGRIDMKVLYVDYSFVKFGSKMKKRE